MSKWLERARLEIPQTLIEKNLTSLLAVSHPAVFAKTETDLPGIENSFPPFDKLPLMAPHGETPRQTEAKYPTDSKPITPSGSNEGILNRLEAVLPRAIQYAAKLKDRSPEQARIADLLDQAHEIEHAEPLDTVKLAAAIGEIETAMKPEPKKTDGKRPLDDQTEYRNERAAILAFSANLPSDEAEYRAILERPCMCGGRKFWVSIFDVIICGRCHPPTQDSFVKRWI